MKRLRVVVAAVAALVAVSGTGRADDHYPSRLITIVVPLSPGTTIDILARLYADKLSTYLGQQVIVANRAGAAGSIAAQTVATAPADGYTVLFANSGNSILSVLNKSLRFDPIKDFAGVAQIGQAPAIVAVPPSLGVNDLAAFIALARSKPGQINFGSAGIGSSTHIAGALFALKTHTELVHVPYTVSANIIGDMLGGRIEAAFVPAAFIMPMLQSNQLKALAVSAQEPMTDPIKVPTAVAQGVDYLYGTWYGILAPAKTPATVLKTLYDAIATVGRDPELQAKIRVQGINPQDTGLADFDAHIRDEVNNLSPLLKTIAETK